MKMSFTFDKSKMVYALVINNIIHIEEIKDDEELEEFRNYYGHEGDGIEIYPGEVSPYPASWLRHEDQINLFKKTVRNYMDRDLGIALTALNCLIIDRLGYTKPRLNGKPVTLKTVADIFGVDVETIKEYGIKEGQEIPKVE